MFQLRRTAFRLLTSQPRSFLSKPRSFATTTPSVFRYSSKPASITFQRRWASSEAEAKEQDEEEPAIIPEEPTPEEHVEDAIHSDNAAEQSGSEAAVDEAAASSDVEPAHQSGEGIRTDTAPSASVPGDESTSKINAAVESIKEAVSNTTATVVETVRNAAGMGSGSARSTSGRSDSAGGRSSGALVEPKSTIYIGNLFFDVTENDLIKELARFGTITKCRLIRDSRGLSKGFGYIDFETIASATKAIEALNQQLFEGRRLTVQYAAYTTRQLDSGTTRPDRPQKPLNPPSKTLFIGNMSFEMTDRDLNSLFRGIKNVIDVRVAIDRRTGQPRGFAHADFVDVKSAMEAMKVLETKETYGRKLRLDYSYGPSNAPRNTHGADRETGSRNEERGEWHDN